MKKQFVEAMFLVILSASAIILATYATTVTLVPTISTSAKPNNPAYINSGSDTAFDPPSSATTEYTSTQYTEIGSADSSYVSGTSSGSTTGTYYQVWQRWTFNLTQYLIGGNSISDITFKWKGYYSATGKPTLDCEMFYYVGSTSTWTVYGDITIGNTEYTEDLGSPSSYLYNSYWVQFGTTCSAYRSTGLVGVTSYADAANLTVTYTTSSGYSYQESSLATVLLNTQSSLSTLHVPTNWVLSSITQILIQAASSGIPQPITARSTAMTLVYGFLFSIIFIIVLSQLEITRRRKNKNHSNTKRVVKEWRLK